MSDALSPTDFSQLSLLEIFQLEAETQGNVLTQQILSLETIPRPRALESLMRAAHSLKGAARIVQLSAVEQLAHALEDCFVQLQRAPRPLQPDQVDVLLAATDWLQKGAAANPAQTPALNRSRQQVVELTQTLQLGSANPGNPGNPGRSVDLGSPSDLGKSVNSYDPGNPVSLDDLGDLGNPGNPSNPGNPGNPGDLGNPDDLGNLSDLGDLGGLSDLGDLGDPYTSGTVADFGAESGAVAGGGAGVGDVAAPDLSLDDLFAEADLPEVAPSLEQSDPSTLPESSDSATLSDLAADWGNGFDQLSPDWPLPSPLGEPAAPSSVQSDIFDGAFAADPAVAADSTFTADPTFTAAPAIPSDPDFTSNPAFDPEPDFATEVGGAMDVGAAAGAAAGDTSAAGNADDAGLPQGQVFTPESMAMPWQQTDLDSGLDWGTDDLDWQTEEADLVEPDLGTPAERMVRLEAGQLSQLMGLAGEVLVESGGLELFSNNLQALKRQQAALTRQIEQLMDEAGSSQAFAAPTDAAQWSAHRSASRHAPTRANAANAAEAAANSLTNSSKLVQALAQLRQQARSCQQLMVQRLGELDEHSRRSSSLAERLYQTVMTSQMQPFEASIQGMTRLVRDLARQLGKSVQLQIQGSGTPVDRDIGQRLEGVLVQLVRNAIDHGIEPPAVRRQLGKPEVGQLTLSAQHRAGCLVITVADDGQGVDLGLLRQQVVQRGLAIESVASQLSQAELLDFLFLPGFSTLSTLSAVSGRGVGLDVVQETVRQLGGTLQTQTQPGVGTQFELQLPLTLSVSRLLLVDIGQEVYGFPLNRIERVVKLPRKAVAQAQGRPYFDLDGQAVGLFMAHQLLKLPAAAGETDDLAVVVVCDRSKTAYGLIVDRLREERDLAVRPLPDAVQSLPHLSAAALLANGDPVLILDVQDMVGSISQLGQEAQLESGWEHQPMAVLPPERQRILVVEDSITVREVERKSLENLGYQVDVAVNGMDGWNAVRAKDYDLVVTDIDMPRMDGIELVRQIRANSNLATLPVVIVSYKDRPEDRLRGLEAGANYYLTKSSFDNDALQEAVTELIGDP